MPGLHEHAVELRSLELAEAMAEVDQEVTQYVQITACDLIGWAYRIAEQSREPVPAAKKLNAIEPDPGSQLHRYWGATWARNRLTHGDAELLSQPRCLERDRPVIL